MKTFILSWFVFQAVLIGVASVSIHNEIVEKTYECPNEILPVSFGVLFPLAVMIPTQQEVINYCY